MAYNVWGSYNVWGAGSALQTVTNEISFTSTIRQNVSNAVSFTSTIQDLGDDAASDFSIPARKAYLIFRSRIAKI